MSSTALLRHYVGVIVERRRARSKWLDHVWRPISVLPERAAAAPWTPIGAGAKRELFYAGDAVIELYRTETAGYRDNLSSGTPTLWVVLRSAAPDAPPEIVTVTADPSEGEAFTHAGNDLVETVAMPPAIIASISSFVAEHHVERAFTKRRRASAGPLHGRTP